jgi:hypothetical protein
MFLREQPPGTRVLTWFDWGEYAIWKAGASRHPGVHGRPSRNDNTRRRARAALGVLSRHDRRAQYRIRSAQIRSGSCSFAGGDCVAQPLQWSVVFELAIGRVRTAGSPRAGPRHLARRPTGFSVARQNHNTQSEALVALSLKTTHWASRYNTDQPSA